MKKAINCVTLLIFAQVGLLLSLSLLPLGKFTGTLSFLLPLCLFFTPYFRSCEQSDIDFSLRPVLSFLPVFPFFIFSVILTSSLTALLSGLVGYTVSPVEPEKSLFAILIFNIVVPAVCEELFCRYAMLRLLAPFGRGGAVVVSALLFAVMHGNFYQMPYAFIAGLFLGSLTLASRSVCVPVVFHMLNNATTVILYHSGAKTTTAVYALLFCALAASLFFCLKNRIFTKLYAILTDKTIKTMLISTLASFAMVYIVFMIILAI